MRPRDGPPVDLQKADDTDRAAAQAKEALARAQKQARVEWYTPPEFIDMARAVLGSIGLDPATCAQAQAYIRARGLAHKTPVPFNFRIFRGTGLMFPAKY